MRKIIKAYGDSSIITFSPEDLRIYELQIGDIIEIHILKVKSQREDEKK